MTTDTPACKRSDDGQHLFLFISWDRPNICYYCSAKEERAK